MMRVSCFEKIGGVNGGAFDFTPTRIRVGSDGVAVIDTPKTNNGNGTPASITGNGAFKEGVILTAPVVTGDPDGDALNPNYSHQWFKGSTAITNATASTYAVPASGAGIYKVAITYTDAQGFTATLDSPDQVVNKPTPSPSPSVPKVKDFTGKEVAGVSSDSKNSTLSQLTSTVPLKAESRKLLERYRVNDSTSSTPKKA